MLSRWCRWIGVGLCFLSLGVQAQGFDNVKMLAKGEVLVSAEARLLDTGEVIGFEQPQSSMIPASVSKLYVASAMLDRFGPRYRFTTRFLSTGPVINGTLQGDLIFDGGGDPALSTRDGWALVQSLRETGIRQVAGRLIVSEWRFGPEPCMTHDRCKARESSQNAFDARLSSAGLDFGSWCVQLTPGQVGEALHVAGCEGMVKPQVVLDAVTVTPGQSTKLNVKRLSEPAGDRMYVSGQLPEGSDAQRIYQASGDPARQSLASVHQLLEQSGIRLLHGSSVSTTPPPASATVLATIESQPLQSEIADMLAYSNNFMADAMTMALSPAFPASLAGGSMMMERFVGAMPGHGPVTLLSGSGLTPENRTSAHGLVTLLDQMYRRPALFPALLAGLTPPQDGTSKFMRKALEPVASHTMIKTGTLNEPIPVRAMSGYFRTATGRWGAFAILINGQRSTTPLNWGAAMDAVSVDLGKMITDH